jgi:hypothetical protein
MAEGVHDAHFTLPRAGFGEKERVAARFGGLTARLFRYDSGIEAVRLSNARGGVVVLPYFGQMVWSAEFDGVALAMESMFAEPRPAKSIVETYGCLAFHSGLLRNGVPSALDAHELHGEAPSAPMNSAGIACGVDALGPWMAVVGERDYAMGFGAHYLARPRVVLREGATSFDVEMTVDNRSAAPMDLMYMCHVNFAFAAGARIVQSAPYTPEHVVVRTAIPGHVVPNDDYRALIAELAANPARMERLDEPKRYDPEQVFYVKGAKKSPDGLVRHLMLRREGDAFSIAWDPVSMPHTIRWILVNGDQRVAAFAMPATCEPEGYAAEKRKGNVRSLAAGAFARFVTHVGYVDAAHADAIARAIEGNRP